MDNYMATNWKSRKNVQISKLLQARRNHSHSLWPSRKEADLFSSQPLGFSALTWEIMVMSRFN